MKTKFLFAQVFLFLLASLGAAFSQTKILGRVMDADSQAVAFAGVRLPGLSAVQTNAEGFFEFRLSKAASQTFFLKSGVDLNIEVEKAGLVMLDPADQKIRLPNNPETQAHFRIVMVKKGSPLLARSERVLEFILRQKIQVAIEDKEKELARRDVLAEQAQRLGLNKEALLSAVTEYKDRLRTSADLNLRGLAALDDANEAEDAKIKQRKLAEAKQNFRQAIAKDEEDVKQGQQAEARLPDT